MVCTLAAVTTLLHKHACGDHKSTFRGPAGGLGTLDGDPRARPRENEQNATF